jgi:hypothetical protein
MGLFGKATEVPETGWQKATHSTPSHTSEQLDTEGLHYMAKGRGGGIEVNNDNIHVWVGDDPYRSYGTFTNNEGGIEMAKAMLDQHKEL